MEIEAVVAFHKSELSFVTRRYFDMFVATMNDRPDRYALEQLFWRVMDTMFRNDKEIKAAMECVPRHLKSRLHHGTPSMSTIENMLKHEGFRKTMWKQLKLPVDLELPAFDGQLLYGKLSEMIHSSHGTFVYMSEDANPVEKRFFREVCAHFGRDIDFFDRKKAELGKILQRKGKQEQRVKQNEKEGSSCQD
eukprot:22571-Hanusia_phi.AAC.1